MRRPCDFRLRAVMCMYASVIGTGPRRMTAISVQADTQRDVPDDSSIPWEVCWNVSVVQWRIEPGAFCEGSCRQTRSGWAALTTSWRDGMQFEYRMLQPLSLGFRRRRGVIDDTKHAT